MLTEAAGPSGGARRPAPPSRATEVARTNYGTPPQKCTSGSRAVFTTKCGDSRAAKKRSGRHLRGSASTIARRSGVSRRKIPSALREVSTYTASLAVTPSISAIRLDFAPTAEAVVAVAVAGLTAPRRILTTSARRPNGSAARPSFGSQRTSLLRLQVQTWGRGF
jgi:hypothetical protein